MASKLDFKIIGNFFPLNNPILYIWLSISLFDVSQSVTQLLSLVCECLNQGCTGIALFCSGAAECLWPVALQFSCDICWKEGLLRSAMDIRIHQESFESIIPNQKLSKSRLSGFESQNVHQCTMCILGTTMALWSKAEIQKYTFWWEKKIFEAIFPMLF